MTEAMLVPYTYEASAFVGRERQPKMVVLNDLVEADVLEITSNDAPIVASLRLTRVTGRTRRSTRSDIRYVDGQFLEPAIDWNSQDGVRTLGSMAYADLASRRLDDLRSFAWPMLQHLAAFTAINAEDVREIVSDNQAACRASALRASQRARLVDGVLYQPGSEPVYVRAPNGTVTSAMLSDVRRKTSPDLIFRADDPDPLLEYACGLPEKDQNKVLDRNSIDIFRPDVLTWDRSSELVRAAANLLVERLPRFLIEAPTEIVHAWVSLRDLDRTKLDTEVTWQTQALLSLLNDAGMCVAVAAEADRLLTSAAVAEPVPDRRMV